MPHNSICTSLLDFMWCKCDFSLKFAYKTNISLMLWNIFKRTITWIRKNSYWYFMTETWIFLWSSSCPFHHGFPMGKTLNILEFKHSSDWWPADPDLKRSPYIIRQKFLSFWSLQCLSAAFAQADKVPCEQFEHGPKTNLLVS